MKHRQWRNVVTRGPGARYYAGLRAVTAYHCSVSQVHPVSLSVIFVLVCWPVHIYFSLFFTLVVGQLSLKVHKNCALCEESVKFGTHIAKYLVLDDPHQLLTLLT